MDFGSWAVDQKVSIGVKLGHVVLQHVIIQKIHVACLRVGKVEVLVNINDYLSCLLFLVFWILARRGRFLELLLFGSLFPSSGLESSMLRFKKERLTLLLGAHTDVSVPKVDLICNRKDTYGKIYNQLR